MITTTPAGFSISGPSTNHITDSSHTNVATTQRLTSTTDNMPQKGKKKAASSPEKGPRTPHQQDEVEQRIWTNISNAMYEAGSRVAEWIKEGGEKQDKRIWAAVDGIKAYTTAYVLAEKERVRAKEMEERRGTRVYEMLTTRAQELSDGLGMTHAPQPRTHAETAAQTGEEGALDETMESQSHTYAETSAQTKESIYTQEDMAEVVVEIEATVMAKLELVATTLEGKMEAIEQEHEAEVERLKERAAIVANEQDKERNRMKDVYEEDVREERLMEENEEPPSNTYTESFSQTEGASDETTAPPEESPKNTETAAQTEEALEALMEENGGRIAPSKEAPTRKGEGGNNTSTLPKEIPTREEEGGESYAQVSVT